MFGWTKLSGRTPMWIIEQLWGTEILPWVCKTKWYSVLWGKRSYPTVAGTNAHLFAHGDSKDKLANVPHVVTSWNSANTVLDFGFRVWSQPCRGTQQAMLETGGSSYVDCNTQSELQQLSWEGGDIDLFQFFMDLSWNNKGQLSLSSDTSCKGTSSVTTASLAVFAWKLVDEIKIKVCKENLRGNWSRAAEGKALVKKRRRTPY